MKRIKIFAILGGFALLAGCFSDPQTGSLSSDLVVATDRNLEADFQDFQTYHISDTIPNIGGTGRDSILVGEDALVIVNQIKENMNARGYVFVPRNENPDIGVIPAILQVQNIGRVCSGWWWGYPGYWGPGYWGYPGYGYYYPYCGYYSYQTGSLTLDLIDLKNVDNSGTLNALWSSAMFGALSSSDATNLSRALKAIDQSFTQSPYIQN